MKKNLALILALVMLMGTVFPVIPMAESTDSTPPAAVEYEPKISYANVNYSDKMYVMFAVPAPAALGEGEAVKLLVWPGKDVSEAFSIKDTRKVVLDAEADKVTIDGAQYLVFKYDALTAAEMTKIIAARPAVIKTWQEEVTTIIPAVKDETTGEVTTPESSKTEIVTKEEAVTYGDIVEYSVLEYVATANGEFGNTKLADNVLEMLDSMLAFGGLAQKYSGKTYELSADDDLAKIWYVPVVNGVEGERVFGGFFKKGADYATVSAPYLDEYRFVSFIDADGNEIYDVDGLVDNGTQVAAPAEGDLVIKASYGPLYMAQANANDATKLSTNLYDDKTGNKYLGTQGHLGFNASASDKKPAELGYAALDIVDDPYQEGNKVHRLSGTSGFGLGMGDSTNDWKFSMKPSAIAGFNDTIAPFVTVDITIARGPDGEILTTQNLRLRSNQNSHLTNLGYFVNDGSFHLYNHGSDTDSYVVLPTKVAETGYTRYVFIVDFVNEVIYAYAAANADTDELTYQAEVRVPYVAGNHATAATWLDWAATLDRIELMANSGANSFSEEELATYLADLDGDGVGETAMIDETGAVNKDAVRWCTAYYRSTYIRNYSTYVGSPVKEFPAHEHTFVEGKCACGVEDPDYVPPISNEEAQALYRQYRALLIKDWDSYIGYAGNPVETIYNIDANAATVPSKNSQLETKNFTDDLLASYYKGEGYDGKTLTLGGLGMNAAQVNAADPLQYAGIDVIDDPYYTGEGANKVYSFNGGVIKEGQSLGAYIWHGKLVKNAAEAYVGSLSATKLESWATTPVITYDMTVGGNGYDRMLETDTIRFRGASNTYVHLFKIAADGSILICKPNADYTDAVFEDTGVDVKKNGWTRIVAEVDFANKTFKLYAADEGAELVLLATVSDNLWITKSGTSHGAATALTTYKDAADWQALAKVLDRTEFVAAAGDANTLTKEELRSVLKD